MKGKCWHLPKYTVNWANIRAQQPIHSRLVHFKMKPPQSYKSHPAHQIGRKNVSLQDISVRHCRNDQAVVMRLQTCTRDARMSQESHSYYTALFSCGSAMLLMKMMVWPLGSNVCALKLRHPGLPSPPRPSVLFGTSLLYQITVTWKPNNIQASLSLWCNYITTITHRTHMKSPSICGGLVKDAGKERSFLRWKTPWKTSQSLPYLQPQGALTGLRWNWRCCRCDAPTPTQTQSCCVRWRHTRHSVKQWAARWRSAATEQINRHCLVQK